MTPDGSDGAARAARSMTGYAAVRHPVSFGELSVSLRSVNHRGLDLHFFLHSELAPFENAIRRQLKAHLTRGHVEVRVALIANAEPQAPTSYNRELVARYVAAFRQACLDFHLQGEPDLTRILLQAGILDGMKEPRVLGPEFESQVLEAFSLCAAELNRHRAREGEELRTAIETELVQLEAGIAQVSSLREGLSAALAIRLRERFVTLLAGSMVPESRILEEVAIQVDRSDVQEELTRLTIHAAELRRVLAEGAEIGKRLDFLLQEINRETNTILSKSSTVAESGLTLTSIGVALKANIERMREQALNLE